MASAPLPRKKKYKKKKTKQKYWQNIRPCCNCMKADCFQPLMKIKYATVLTAGHLKFFISVDVTGSEHSVKGLLK